MRSEQTSQQGYEPFSFQETETCFTICQEKPATGSGAGVERNFNMVKRSMAVAPRYDKLRLTYRGVAVLRAISIWLAALEETP